MQLRSLLFSQFCSFFVMDSSDSEGKEAPTAANGSTKAVAKKPAWKRGAKMTAQKRAGQFSGDFEVRGEAMWCSVCHVPVSHAEKSYATSHLLSSAHKANAIKRPKVVVKFGPSPQAESTPAQEVCFPVGR